jgi:hypothetical protein
MDGAGGLLVQVTMLWKFSDLTKAKRANNKQVKASLNC